MENPDRYVPVDFLQDTIKNGTGVPDPAGTSDALMYYSQMTRNGKLYNLEVLYDEATNTVFHFEYTRRPLGPFDQIPKP